MKIILRFIKLVLIWICLSAPIGCSTDPDRTGLDKITYDYLKKVGASAIALDKTCNDIVGLKQLNTDERLKTAEKKIDRGKKCIERLEQNVRRYKTYIFKNRKIIKQAGLTHYIEINGVFGQERSQRIRTLDDYFTAMKKWLNYSIRHFDQIKNGSRQHRSTYDALLVDVNRKLEIHNSANQKFSQYIRAYLKRYPAIPSQFKREYANMKGEMGWL